MYIHSTFKQITPISDSSIYKKQLKEISKINLRQSSKFNALAVFGALKCLENVDYDKNLSIYLSSEYSCTQNMLNVITQVNTKDDLVMPFDFLNVNTNNAGFFIAQALNVLGENINITCQDLSFEQAFWLAYFDFSINKISEFLIGGVDESLEGDLVQDYKLVHNLQSKRINDGTAFIFLSKKEEGAIAKVKDFLVYENIEQLNLKLDSINFDKIDLNQYAKKYQNLLNINQDLMIPNPIFNIVEERDEFYGTSSAGDIVNLLEQDAKNLIYISLDAKKRAYLFIFEKLKR